MSCCVFSIEKQAFYSDEMEESWCHDTCLLCEVQTTGSLYCSCCAKNCPETPPSLIYSNVNRPTSRFYLATAHDFSRPHVQSSTEPLAQNYGRTVPRNPSKTLQDFPNSYNLSSYNKRLLDSYSLAFTLSRRGHGRHTDRTVTERAFQA